MAGTVLPGLLLFFITADKIEPKKYKKILVNSGKLGIFFELCYFYPPTVTFTSLYSFPFQKILLPITYFTTSHFFGIFDIWIHFIIFLHCGIF